MTSPISVKDRLKKLAVVHGKTMQEELTAYGLERTIYRVSVSDYKDRFTLKGGIFLYALFDGEFARTTQDIDLLAQNLSNGSEQIKNIFVEIFAIQCDDALYYDLETMKVTDITEFKEYHGVRVSIMAYLDRTRVPVSIDIGFGDVIYPERVKMGFPVLLGMEQPVIYAYSLYSVIAEKFEAIVSLGDVNSRYKDFYDIYILATKYSFDGNRLQNAVQETFRHRRTGFDDIIAFTEGFAESDLHNKRWNAFLSKKKAMIKVDLKECLVVIKIFLLPVVESIRMNVQYMETWSPALRRWEKI